jgi:predicted thioesterase
MQATIQVTVAEVKGRAVTFEVEGRDDKEPICRGRHTRFMVDVAKTRERLKLKRAA